MKYVLDSCVGLKWLLKEIDSDKALRIRDDFRRQVHDFSRAIRNPPASPQEKSAMRFLRLSHMKGTGSEVKTSVNLPGWLLFAEVVPFFGIVTRVASPLCE
jgi:hypothetical protein